MIRKRELSTKWAEARGKLKQVYNYHCRASWTASETSYKRYAIRTSLEPGNGLKLKLIRVSFCLWKYFKVYIIIGCSITLQNCGREVRWVYWIDRVTGGLFDFYWMGNFFIFFLLQKGRIHTRAMQIYM